MDLPALGIQLGGLLPAAVLVVVAISILLTRSDAGQRTGNGTVTLALVGVGVAWLAVLYLWGNGETVGAKGLMPVGRSVLLFFNVFLLGTGLTIMISPHYLRGQGIHHKEYYALLLFATVGMMVMAAGTDLLMLFIGIEILSVAAYVLAGFMRSRAESNEAALKYFLLGSFATAWLLYGVALIYGATGSINLEEIGRVLAAEGKHRLLALTGLGLLFVGFGFKLALVPFHMWVPDVYEGSPTPVAAFLSAGPKVAGFAALLRVLLLAFPTAHMDWRPLLALIAILTMTLGNVVAVAQTNLKRMLAYSTIAHAGYVIVGVVAAPSAGFSSILFYLLGYTFMNLGAFAVVIACNPPRGEALSLHHLSALAGRNPFLAMAMAVFMLSLAGIPPTVGFIGKFYVFSAAVSAGYLYLVIIGVLNSVISVYYYLRVVVYMYMGEPGPEVGFAPVPLPVKVALTISLLATLQLGVFPGLLIDLVNRSGSAFL